MHRDMILMVFLDVVNYSAMSIFCCFYTNRLGINKYAIKDSKNKTKKLQYFSLCSEKSLCKNICFWWQFHYKMTAIRQGKTI